MVSRFALIIKPQKLEVGPLLDVPFSSSHKAFCLSLILRTDSWMGSNSRRLPLHSSLYSWTQQSNLHTTLHWTTLHYTTIHYSTLHYTTLHYTTLHYCKMQCDGACGERSISGSSPLLCPVMHIYY